MNTIKNKDFFQVYIAKILLTFKHSIQMKRYIPFYPLFVFLWQSILMGGVSFRRIPLFLVYLLRFILMEPLRIVEILLYERRIQRHVLKEDPIFILGHWRSGTSHVQNLLQKDSKFGTLTLYRMLFSDHFIWTEPWLLPILNRLSNIFRLRYSFQRTTLDFKLSGEFDTALCSLGSTEAYTWAHLFPKNYQRWMNKHVFVEGAASDLSDYDYIIRKVSFQAKNKRIIVKSPGDTARIQALLKRYPNASFIYLWRDSYDVYHSSMYLWKAIQRENSLQHLTPKEISELVLWTYPLVLENYERGKAFIPKRQLFEVSFDDLHDNTENVLQKAYDQLFFGDFDPSDFATFLSLNKAHRKANYEKDSDIERQLKLRWGTYYQSSD